MVIKMMKWPPWPPLSSRKFEVVIVVHRLVGMTSLQFDGEKEMGSGKRRLVVEIKWKGSKSMALSSLRRSVLRNFTEEGGCCGDGVVDWNEEFKNVCSFPGYKEGVFLPWEVAFTVFKGFNHGPRNNVSVIGTALLNLAEFASSNEEKHLEVKIPVTVSGGGVECSPSLVLSLKLTARGSPRAMQRSVLPFPLSPCYAEGLPTERKEHSAVKAGLRKVKTFTDYVSKRGAKKAFLEEESSDGRSSVRSEDAKYNDSFDTDSLDENAEGQSEESTEDASVCQSVSYETLAYANCLRGSLYSNMNAEDESWIYYSNHRPYIGRCHAHNSTPSAFDQSPQQSSKRGILSWRKRKLSFRSPKAKGEPLLKKDCQEEGGDDIDFDRRQLSSSDESSFGWYQSIEGSATNGSSDSEFGDDNFAVGSWESKEIISRDGLMKLQAQVFFASIDQRSERAAGESACTALVAVIANWLQSNRKEMPIKSEFDSLIREGSLGWRNLCENEYYREHFPDKHFDLETVLQANICPLCLVPEKSFIGFFHPEGLEEEGGFDFLHGAMSFDSIWEEISHHESDQSGNTEPLVYIVSWNDHFFVLKVEQDSYYIIDTLGERLYEGCDQAYVLKFDKDATIERLPNDAKANEKSNNDKDQRKKSKETSNERTPVGGTNESVKSEKGEIVCRGKESCKEYIKSFLAAIPIRELQADMKKGLISSAPLHHRLQIEFHYTRLLQPEVDNAIKEAMAEAPVLATSLVVA